MIAQETVNFVGETLTIRNNLRNCPDITNPIASGVGTAMWISIRTDRMNYPHLPARGSSIAGSLGVTRKQPGPNRSQPLTRRYDITYVAADRSVGCTTKIAPAMPAFEEAFSAFARGTLIATAKGPVAVEDLVPGQLLLTSEGPLPLRWRGSITLFPTRAPGATAPLTRIPAHTFGPERPAEDLVFGPAARFVERRAQNPADQIFSDPQDCADGETALAIRPLAPVPVFHLALDRQVLVMANGIETISYHPSMSAKIVLRGELSKVFLKLFPHLSRISDFGRPLAGAMDMRSVA